MIKQLKDGGDEKALLPHLQEKLNNIDPLLTVNTPVLGSELHPAELQEILELRRKNYAHSTPYLLGGQQISLDQDLQLDERSIHFSVCRRDQIISTVRLTPPPFELKYLSPSMHKDDDKLKQRGFFELSRMTTKADETKNGAGLLLIFSLANWGFSSNSTGVFGLCKGSNIKRFRMFGFEALSSGVVTIPSRDFGQYRLLGATWEDINNRAKKLLGIDLFSKIW